MRIIDADILERSLTEIDEHINMDIFTNEVRELIDNAPPVEAIPKDQYEARLKADMVAMLTEIQLEIEELDSRAGYDGNGMPTFSTDYIRKKKVNEIIQQKIDKLTGEQE